MGGAAVRVERVSGGVRDLRAALADDVRDGLRARPKRLPPKYFYDERGSRLFEAICRTPEYYPTRTEDALLARHALEIVEAVRPAELVELGSGSSRKTVHLTAACERLGCHCVYRPVDVCAAMLEEAAARLTRAHAWLRVAALVGEYEPALASLPPPRGPRLFAFLGGTLGNFEDAEARGFLRRLRRAMVPGDALLLGADRVKDRAVLDAAYNDAAGHTEAFNLNVLNVINRELGAGFRPRDFRHRAFFDPARSRVEMHLVARKRHRVSIGALSLDVAFDQGESILTEISRKFTAPEIEGLLAAVGLEVRRHYAPDNGYYSLLLAVPGAGENIQHV